MCVLLGREAIDVKATINIRRAVGSTEEQSRNNANHFEIGLKECINVEHSTSVSDGSVRNTVNNIVQKREIAYLTTVS